MLRFTCHLLCSDATDWAKVVRRVVPYVPRYYVPLEKVVETLNEDVAALIKRNSANFFAKNPDQFDLRVLPKEGFVVVRNVSKNNNETAEFPEYELSPETVVRLAYTLPNEYIQLVPTLQSSILELNPKLKPMNCAWRLESVMVMFPSLFEVKAPPSEWALHKKTSLVRSLITPRRALGNAAMTLDDLHHHLKVVHNALLRAKSKSVHVDSLQVILPERTVEAFLTSNLSLLDIMEAYPNCFAFKGSGGAKSLVRAVGEPNILEQPTWYKLPSERGLDKIVATNVHLHLEAASAATGLPTRNPPKAQKWGKDRQKQAIKAVGKVSDADARVLAESILLLLPEMETFAVDDLIKKMDSTDVIKTRARSWSTARFLNEFPELFHVEELNGQKVVTRASTMKSVAEKSNKANDVSNSNNIESGAYNPYFEEENLIDAINEFLERGGNKAISAAGVLSALPEDARKAVMQQYDTLAQFLMCRPGIYECHKFGGVLLVRLRVKNEKENGEKGL